MLDYRVSSLLDLDDTIRDHDATHVVSLLDPGDAAPGHDLPHLHLPLRDVMRTGQPGDPALDQVATLALFARGISPGGRPVFHCMAGVSRSAAAALVADLAVRLDRGATPGQDLLDDALALLARRRPQAVPNTAILRLGDTILGLDGLLAAYRPVRTLDLRDD